MRKYLNLDWRYLSRFYDNLCWILLIGRWVPCGRTDPETTELEVTGLEPGKKYEFRVKAKNEEGESDPLDGENPIIAKDPFGMLYFCDDLMIFKHKLLKNKTFKYIVQNCIKIQFGFL